MKRILLLIPFYVFTLNCISQNSYKEQLDDLSQKMSTHIWTNKDSAFYYQSKIKALAEKEKDWIVLTENYINQIRCAGYFSRREFDMETIRKNLNALDNLFVKQDSFFNNHPDFPFYKNCLLNDRASYQFQLDDYSLAQNTFDELIENLETDNIQELSPEDFDLLTNANIFKAKMYSDEGKYELSKVYYEKNIRLIKQYKPHNKKKLYSNYSLLGEVFKREGNPKKSNAYFTASLNYKLETNGKKNGIVSDAQNIIQNHIKLQQIDSANYYLDVLKSHLKPGDGFWTRYHKSKSQIHEYNNNYLLAKEEQFKTLAIFKEKWNNKKHLEIAQSYHGLGLIDLKFDKPKEAVKNFDLAISEITEKNTTNSTLNNTALLKIYKSKIEALSILKDDAKIMTTAKLASHLLDKLKPTFKTEADKLLLIEDAFPIFEASLKATYNITVKTNMASLIDLGFEISEKSKSTLLLEALLSSKATNFGNIPEDLLENEKQLKSEINYLEKKIDQSKKDTSILKDKLFNVKKGYQDLIEIIETKYKSYYDLKYNTNVLELSDVSKHLEEDDILVSYFYGKNAIYVISITKNRKQFSQIILDETLDNLIKEVYVLLSNPKSDLDLLNSKSHKLYKLILEPYLIDKPKKNLIVLADGLLNFIPFSSLNTSENNTHYLIEDYAISYANSATLLRELQKKQRNNNKVLAFAPSFNNSKLLELPHNTKEVEKVLSHFNGVPFKNHQATLENFNKNSSNYSILHLATHAIFDDQRPEYSYLAFSEKENQSNALYVRDLYSLKLNSDLVTLSACESGIGNLNRGEGFMSLARGFYFSGASSISSTLWKINDASSSLIMNDFYKHLSKKESKNKALQQAQLNFLKTNKDNALRHPYYWSGFIISGNTMALSITNYWLWILIGCVALLLILYVTRRRST